MNKLELLPGNTTITQLIQFIDSDAVSVSLDRSCQPGVELAAAVVNAVINADDPVYGVNTGFGKLSSVRIAAEDSATLQRNLILSHCAGVGEVTDLSIVRLMMVLKLLSLGRGASGVRWLLIEGIENLLNSGITPVVPSQGSVGASGDLAPLAHFAAVLMGEGEVFYQNRKQTTKSALQQAGLAPVKLIAKEGLALINGTQFSTAAALVALHHACLLYTSPSPRD